MSKRVTVLNIIYALVDAVLCIAAVAGFAYAALHFDKWWITLFSFVPLGLFSSHTLVLDAQIEEAKKRGEEDSKT